MPLHKVLVYGTLKSGHTNHAILTESEGTQRLLGVGETVSAFPLVVGTFLNIPYLLYAPGEGVSVEGEIYEVDDVKLARLDKLERLYERKLEKVRLLDSNDIVEAWVYALMKWADDFRAKSSAPLRSYHEQGKDHGRPLLNGRARESFTQAEGRQFYIDLFGYFPEDAPIIHRIFVYGTLKKGQANHKVLTDSEGTLRAFGSARSVDRFPLVIGTKLNIPFVLNAKGMGEHVLGEIYEVNGAKLAILDALEGHPILYERKLEQFVMEASGVITEAWIYIIDKWSDSFPDTCSNPLSSYSSDGPHGRPFLDTEKLSDDEEAALLKEIKG
ncbi:hypothetical protein PENTCL1PPCAC_26073 [Pristionchus entomophagus]|uniref:Gamma-glutamylcyclotransferase family protein n=1 Tax=Pristionchus entomophagus TaxID=358040 RepID=A0AAV5UBZ1_9BILA|nr:hypothetical protein PENTCL1PPCAC_26073 [Pristionchus entomophagus]